jgi:hypothetical protein
MPSQRIAFLRYLLNAKFTFYLIWHINHSKIAEKGGSHATPHPVRDYYRSIDRYVARWVAWITDLPWRHVCSMVLHSPSVQSSNVSEVPPQSPARSHPGSIHDRRATRHNQLPLPNLLHRRRCRRGGNHMTVVEAKEIIFPSTVIPIFLLFLQ